jgi:hypothetical protein
MGTITLIINMTGLLLLAPNTHSGGFPLHVLMPIEGQSGKVPLHIAELGWRSSDSACPSTAAYRFESGVCYFNLDGWSVELGQGGTPTSGVVVPPAGPLDVSYGRKVNPVWFGMNPGGSIRSRVSIHSGLAMPGCPFASWTLNGIQDVQLPNVVTWATAIPGPGLTLTATKLNMGSGTPITVDFKIFPTPTNTIELFLRQEPAETMRVGSPPFTSPHLHAFYDLLGYPNEERLFPQDGYPTGRRCVWSKPFDDAPGSPTCLIGIGYPTP